MADCSYPYKKKKQKKKKSVAALILKHNQIDCSSHFNLNLIKLI